MISDHTICENSKLVGKAIGWVRKNFEDLEVVGVRECIEAPAIINPPDDYIIKAGNHIRTEGPYESIYELIRLSVPSAQ